MTARIAEVLEAERKTDEGIETVDVKVEVSQDDTMTAEHFAPVGFDAPPLPGDNALVHELAGAGEGAAVGYHDPKNPGKAAPGEVRTYARDASGAVVAEIWAKGSGDIEIVALKAGGKIKLGKVEIDQDGNITTPGDLTVKDETPATAVTVSTHVHPTGVGPSGPPQPGT
jgi:hypothetical protein